MNIGKNKIKIEKKPKPYNYIQHTKLPILVLAHKKSHSNYTIKGKIK